MANKTEQDKNKTRNVHVKLPVQQLNFETFVRAAMQTGKPPKPAKKAKKRAPKK